MRTLPGYEVAHTDYAELLGEIDALIFKLVYRPIIDIVRPSLPRVLRAELAPRIMQESTARELHNAEAGEEALRKALRDGSVQMIADHTGKRAVFSVAKPDRRISDGLKAFGAKVDKLTGLWSCPPAAVPAWVRFESQGYAMKARAAHDAVKELIDKLGSSVDNLIDEASFARGADHAISEVQKGAWKLGAKKIEASWNLGLAGQEALAAGFERTRDIAIKSPGSKVSVVSAFDESAKREVKVWAKEALARLRAEVDENAHQGFRAEGLAEKIRNEYGVSKSRADLIARQETSNFMANYRQARATDAGLRRYEWFCVRDSRTRKDHLALNRRIFRYDQPPITDTRTGARNNPGQDFRCRCTDRPVLE